MKISTQALKFINERYGSAGDSAPNGVDDLLEKIGSRLGAVEEVIQFGRPFEDVIIVRVVSCEDHPNADRLHVCMIDDGGRAQNVERNEQGLVQVVCGAPNVHADMFVAWLPPGSTVPSTYDKDPFVLEARELRGVVSNGMLASPKELGLSDGHEGILEIVIESDEHIEPGMPFAEAYHLTDDVVIDMENKMFTHRPDCFGWLGIAREFEGIQHRAYKSPEWYQMNPEVSDIEAEELPLVVRNELGSLVPRFTAITMRDVEIKESPVWLQVDLARAGLRPINNIVDYTNFYMLETGQPLHAYDYDKVKALSDNDHATIVVRHPHENERVTLLNGKEIEPRREAIMIATDKQLIGIGGVMGGSDTEVDENTKNIILECANFDMYSIRRTAMAHGLFTDAVTRFNKGQSPLQNLAVLGKITDKIRQSAGGKVASKVIDNNHLPGEMLERGSVHAPVAVTIDFVNARLGWQLSADEMAHLLHNVEFTVDINENTLTVKAPFWRTDIEIPEDVVEEIGRLRGFDQLPLELPKRSLVPATKDRVLSLKDEIRDVLSRAGANEVLTYSFIHGNLLDKVGQDRGQAFQLSNALSPDLQYLRLSMTPSLLEKVHSNVKAGFDEFGLFEINKVHCKSQMDDDGLPREFMRIGFVYTADQKAAQQHAGAPYYQARKYADILLNYFGASPSLVWVPLAKADFGGHVLIEQMCKPFEPNRSAALVKGDLIVGVIGEYRASIQKSLKLPTFTAGFELFMSPLQKSDGKTGYVQLPRFPKVEQDICLKVPVHVTYSEVYELMRSHLLEKRPDQTYFTVAPVDIYQREDDADHKQITLRLSLASYERTLTDDEVNHLLEEVARAAQEKFGAERI